MNPMKSCVFCVLALFGTTVMAVDPSDEDVSYLPDNILNSLVESRYGYDQKAYENCLARSTKGGGPKAVKAREEKCRVQATPEKCRQFSPLPPDKT